MINTEKTIVLDIDGTLCPSKDAHQHYSELVPYPDMLALIREYKRRGFYLIYHTSRNMRTHNGNIGKINADTLRTLFAWFERHDIPYDEIYIGKPWPGEGGFIVDDRAVRPSEFRELSYDDIQDLLHRETRSAP